MEIMFLELEYNARNVLLQILLLRQSMVNTRQKKTNPRLIRIIAKLY